MEFKKQKTIYLQIAESLCDRALAGEWDADGRIPSVRDVAASLGVNPNTVMRSFESLQQSDIIYTKRGMGYFLSSDAKEKIIELYRKEFLEEELPAIMQRMRYLGLDASIFNQQENTKEQ
ncbi:MAG: GntR family transcriptional regulator [Bacteroidales bacterium]|nr:GntR family transcriptional regulator [Bacteroidales bacterium]